MIKCFLLYIEECLQYFIIAYLHIVFCALIIFSQAEAEEKHISLTRIFKALRWADSFFVAETLCQDMLLTIPIPNWFKVQEYEKPPPL